MHLVFGIVEVLALLDVLASQPWNRNIYSTKPGNGFPYPFQQYGYKNHITPSPYVYANPSFYAGHWTAKTFNGQEKSDWPGLVSHPNEILPNFEKSNNQLVRRIKEGFPGIGSITNGEKHAYTFGPILFSPHAGNSRGFVRDQSQEFPKSGTGLIFQDTNEIPEAAKNTNNVLFFKPSEYKLNAPEEQINSANTFGHKNWILNSHIWPQFPSSVANFYEPFKYDNERKASSSLLGQHSNAQAIILSGGGPSSSQNVPTFIPPQRDNNQIEFFKYGSQQIKADIKALENKLFSQRNLELQRYFPISSDYSTFPDYLFERDEPLNKPLIGINENGFPAEDQVENKNFPTNEKIVATYDADGVNESPAFRENLQNFGQNNALNSKAFFTKEFRQEYGENDPTEYENVYIVDNNLLLSPSNEAAEKKILINDMLKVVSNMVDDKNDGDVKNLEFFENTIDESLHGPAGISFATQESQTNNWDPFIEDGQLHNEISFEENPLSLSSKHSSTSDVYDNHIEVNKFIPFYVPNSDIPVPFMKQIQMIKAEDGEYLKQDFYYFDSTDELKNFNEEISIDALINIILSAKQDDSKIVLINSTAFDEIIEFLSAKGGEHQPSKPWEGDDVIHTADLPGIKVVTEYIMVRSSKIIDEIDQNLEKEMENSSDPASGKEEHIVNDPNK